MHKDEARYYDRKFAVIHVERNDNNHWNHCFWTVFNYGSLSDKVFEYEAESFKTRQEYNNRQHNIHNPYILIPAVVPKPKCLVDPLEF